MGRFKCPTNDFKDNLKWVSYPLSCKTSPIQTWIRQGHSYSLFVRNENSSTTNDRNGSFGGCPSKFGFLCKPIPNIKGGRVIPPHFQSAEIKSICLRKQIPTCESEQSTDVSATQRLYGQNRPFECLFSFEHSACSQTVSSSGFRRTNPPNDMSSVRVGLCSESLCLCNQLGGPSLTGERNKDTDLSGRFSYSPPRQRYISNASPVHSQYSGIPRLANQLQQIDSFPSDLFAISGNNLGSRIKQYVPTDGEMSLNKFENSAYHKMQESQPETDSESTRQPKFCWLCNPIRPVKLSKTTTTVQLSPSTRPDSHVSPAKSSAQRTEMVVTKCQKEGKNFSTTSKSLHFNRCLWHRLGLPDRSLRSLGHLVRVRSNSSLKYEGDASYSKCSKRARSCPGRFLSFCSIGQQDSPIIPSQRRRNEIQALNEAHLSNFSNITKLQYSFNPPLSPRKIQCRGRSPLKRFSSFRMASASSIDNESFQQVGTSPDRPFCIQRSSCCTHLCDLGCKGRTGPLHRCIFPHMAIQFGMGLPPTIPDSKSLDTSKQRDRSLLIDCPQMGQGFLESRSKKTCCSSSSVDSQLTGSLNRYSDEEVASKGERPNVGDMEMWGWNSALKSWTPTQMELLRTSWRDSTKRSYSVAWRRWCTWSKNNKVSIESPSGSDLARFLSDLFLKDDLSYNTIIFHKAVISTLCDPNKTSPLSKHPLVTRILKAISVQKPKQIKPPIWDIDVVSSWLANSFDVNFSLYECSRRTACILLLCSGRRVHDLTLLSTDTNHFSISDSEAIFWPLYGSKTDSYTHRQSGWKLINNEQSAQALNPVFWVKSLVDLSRSRREESKISNLFLTVRGFPKAASRTVLANWIKSVLRESGIEASAGSTRSAVASKNWVMNFPLDQILERGNWKSHNTFVRFYKREIRPSTSAPTITHLFKPV